jgi:hypothetical protein
LQLCRGLLRPACDSSTPDPLTRNAFPHGVRRFSAASAVLAPPPNKKLVESIPFERAPYPKKSV